MRLILCCLLAGASLASGCASIVNGTTQIVTVETHRDHAPVEDASCELTNSKGSFHVRTPGTVPVSRAYGDLTVRCEKTGMDPGMATVASATKAMAFGNILFGGAIGAAVDTASGAAYDYPEIIRIEMGFNVVRNGMPTPTGTITAATPPAPSAVVAAAVPVPAAPAAAPRETTSTAPSSGKPVAMDDLRHLLAPR